MHMADALISPVVGGATLLAGFGVISHSSKQIEVESVEERLPQMAIAGAFVFAVQMLNFSIPGTGSSGHLVGALLLAIILGKDAAFLTMSAILLIQALFFADGGLLAYGCNIINMGFFACYIAYPYIYTPLAKKFKSTLGSLFAIMITAIISMQIGAFAVVIETILSGKTELPFLKFLLFMQSIHLAIAVVEAFITFAVVEFLHKYTKVLDEGVLIKNEKALPKKRGLLVAAALVIALIAGVFSNFASSSPDGLEWSIEKVLTGELLSSNIGAAITSFQESIAPFPDYSLANSSVSEAVSTGTAGILGAFITVVLILLIGLSIKKIRFSNKASKC